MSWKIWVRDRSMAPFNRSYTAYYQSTLVSVSCAIFELFDVEEYHDLEITHSRCSVRVI